MTIHAYTEVTGMPMPGYVNVSERFTKPEDVVITVRGTGEQRSSSLILNKEQACKLATDILEHYNGTP